MSCMPLAPFADVGHDTLPPHRVCAIRGRRIAASTNGRIANEQTSRQRQASRLQLQREGKANLMVIEWDHRMGSQNGARW